MLKCPLERLVPLNFHLGIRTTLESYYCKLFVCDIPLMGVSSFLLELPYDCPRGKVC